MFIYLGNFSSYDSNNYTAIIMTLKHCKLTFHQKSQQSQQKAYAS